MGLDYAYIFIVPADRMDALRAAISLRLRDDSRSDRRRVGDRLGVAFRFPIDGALQRYGEETKRASADFVDLGYVYLSERIGKRYAFLRATAATTGMSELFEESPSIRATMRSIGQEAGANSVLLDREDYQFVQVWPASGVGVAFDPDAIDENKVDRWCESLLSMTVASDIIVQWPDCHTRWLTRDRDFYDALGEERPGHPCRAVGCVRGAVPLSVFCRRHHFEHVMHRPCPFQS